MKAGGLRQGSGDGYKEVGNRPDKGPGMAQWGLATDGEH